MPTPSLSFTQPRLWALLLGSSVAYFFSINEADNDLWGHVFFGREILAERAIARIDSLSYTAAGLPWINHEWLSQVVLGATYEVAGSAGLLLLKFTVACTAFLLVFGLVRRRTQAPHVWGAVGLVTIAIMSRGFAIRPQMFTYCGAALTLWALDRYQRGQRGTLWLFPALFGVWVNLHGGFILGLGILGWFAAATLVDAERRSWHSWVAWLGSLAATGLNPYGPRLLLYVWNELSRAHPITEWQRAMPTDPSQVAFFATFAGLVVTLPLLRRWRTEGWLSVLAIGMGLMAMRHQRHTPVFALCAAAPLAAQLERATAWLQSRAAFTLSTISRRMINGALAVLAAAQLGLTAVRVARDGVHVVFDPRDYPMTAVRALAQVRPSLNLAVPLDWGEYVLWFLAPQVKVSLDGRFATVYPERIVENNFDFFSGGPGWQRLLELYPTEAVLLPADWPCPIRRHPQWRRVLGDAVAELWVRADLAERVRVDPSPVERATARFP